MRLSRRDLEHKVADAIQANAELERRRREAEERAARTEDIRGGVLAIHQPHAQHVDDKRVPDLFCTTCPASWPCETVQFLYCFGKYAPESTIGPTEG